jgi:hypothetical protein
LAVGAALLIVGGALFSLQHGTVAIVRAVPPLKPDTFGGIWPLLYAMRGQLLGFFLSYVSLLIWFGSVYAALNRVFPPGIFHGMSEHQSLWDFVIFSMSNAEALTYGPITPDALPVRFLASLEWTASNLGMIVVILGLLLPHFTSRQQHRRRRPRIAIRHAHYTVWRLRRQEFRKRKRPKFWLWPFHRGKA